MKGILIAGMLICLRIPALSQSNLVLNPDFELMWRCPSAYDQIKYARYWRPVDTVGPFAGDTLGNGNCAPEFCHVCASQGMSSVPDNFLFFQYPHSGNGMAQ